MPFCTHLRVITEALLEDDLYSIVLPTVATVVGIMASVTTFRFYHDSYFWTLSVPNLALN